MEYELPPVLGTEGVGAGTSVLLAGPPGTGKRELLWAVLTSGREGGSVLVTMTDPVDALGFGSERAGPDEPEGHAVDASGDPDRSTIDGRSEPNERVEAVEGPDGSTDIGLSLSSRLDELSPPNPNRRVGVDGVAPLLDAVGTVDYSLVKQAFDTVPGTRATDGGYAVRTVDDPEAARHERQPGRD